MMRIKQMTMIGVVCLVVLSMGFAAADSKGWEIYENLSHNHDTASHHSEQICGDHVCKPGEKYKP